jgi:hypothetical protein
MTLEGALKNTHGGQRSALTVESGLDVPFTYGRRIFANVVLVRVLVALDLLPGNH